MKKNKEELIRVVELSISGIEDGHYNDQEAAKKILKDLHEVAEILSRDFRASERYLPNHYAQEAMFFIRAARSMLKDIAKEPNPYWRKKLPDGAAGILKDALALLKKCRLA